MRREKDSLGEKRVPRGALYGIHTVRSLENFGAAGEPLPRELIRGMVRLKWACAAANAGLGCLPGRKSRAIIRACRRVLAGGLEAQFPVDVFQAGSGTSSNMNVNEVLANLACEMLGGRRGDRGLVHPNDDVNRGQSTNDVFPSALRIAAVELWPALRRSLGGLMQRLKAKAAEFADVRKSGRTHLQDAVPVTLGLEFAAYRRALAKDVVRLEQAADRLRELPIGGNAVGTGINTPAGFRRRVIRELNRITGGAYRPAEDGLEAVQFLTDPADLSAALRLLAGDLHKLCNDLRLLASGPRTGFNELVLPAVEPGSSIMPGKVNPGICEAANMACLQVFGNDQAVALACAAGQLELNTHMPLVGLNLVLSLQILERTCRLLDARCVAGIRANRAVCRRHFEASPALATLLNPALGYDRVAELVKESLRRGRTLRELVLEKRLMTPAAFARLLRGAIGPARPPARRSGGRR